MEWYNEALRLARQVFERLQAQTNYVLESPMYVMIKSNKNVASLREQNAAGDEEEDSICECKSSNTDQCGLDSNCINRALLVKSNPKFCPAGESCQNQCIKREQYPALAAQWIPNKRVINNKELARRIKQKQEQKNKNVNFLTVDSKLTIDAGPNCNLTQFINHSCKPNCEMLMWKLTFNYNFETFGDQKKICQCCASKCPGLIVSQGKENCNEETTTVLRVLQVQIATWITYSSAQTPRVTTTAATTAPPPTTPAAKYQANIAILTTR
ncbi:histone-lysine N-methyltransferase NSD2 [Culex quinquefasciatus]|uniref:histone-lysine N-methyltransferase NSD2 n=1 Tax=Culex quinquefasciatus TaxID=7176 RepID=UPI0018E33671|nr:histone-lysine N-methyltransferase NSD2 [Culex quinquefasciatus]